MTNTGTLVLTSALNNYSGGTTVNSGATLQGTTSSLQGDITDNGTVAFNQSTTGTYAGVISGTGAVTVGGTGAVTLSNTNTYSGATNIANGATLALSSTGSIANSAVAANGAFDISAANSGGVSIVSLGGEHRRGDAGQPHADAFECERHLRRRHRRNRRADRQRRHADIVRHQQLQRRDDHRQRRHTGAVRQRQHCEMAVAAGGTLDISGTTSGASIGSLSGAGVVTLGSRTLTLSNAGGTFSGAIGGTGGD